MKRRILHFHEFLLPVRLSLKKFAHHTTHATTTDCFDDVNIGTDNVSDMLLDGLNLFGSERLCGTSRRDKVMFSVGFCADLQNISAELVDLIASDLDDLVSGRTQRALHTFTLFFFFDRFETYDGHCAADAHHDVCMVDGSVLGIGCVEETELIPHSFSPSSSNLGVASLG